MKILSSDVALCHIFTPQERGDALTKSLASNHSKNTPPGHRVSTPQQAKDSRVCPQGGLSQRFTIADYRKLETIAKAEPFEGLLKIIEVPAAERIGNQPRYRVAIWEPDPDSGGGRYRQLAGQFNQCEAHWIDQRFSETRDKAGFIAELEYCFDQAIRVCCRVVAREVAA